MTIDNATVCDSTISNQLIENRTISGLSSSESVSPIILSVSSDNSSDNYSVGSNISVTVTFNESVFVDNSTGNPRIELETGSTDDNATYISGNSSSVLKFIYTVGSGDNSDNLSYKSTSSLSANGGTIRDNSSNDATLTLPSPGSTDSLGANRTIVIDTTAPTVTFNPANGDTGFSVSGDILITFNEPVLHINNNGALTGNIHALIILRYDDTDGANISKGATYNNKVITISPSSDLDKGEDVYVYIGQTVEDHSGNKIPASTATFTTTNE